MKKTLTIVGGGVAGLGLANGLANRGIPVRVLEAGAYPRHRVCGEFITSLNSDTIDALGIGNCMEGAIKHRRTAWFRDNTLIKSYNLPSAALGISRYRMDSCMAVSLQQKGGQLIQNHRDRIGLAEGRLMATGRAPASGGRTGLKGHWSSLPLQADLELHLGRGAYLGLSRVEDGYVNVCGIFKSVAAGTFATPLDRFYATLQQTGFEKLRQRLDKAQFRPGSFCSVSGLSYRMDSSIGIGDCYRQIPPFTGHGMTLALDSAATALPLAVAWSNNQISWQAFHQQLHQALGNSTRKRCQVANALHPFMTRPSLQSLLILLSRINLVPFTSLYRQTHG